MGQVPRFHPALPLPNPTPQVNTPRPQLPEAREYVCSEQGRDNSEDGSVHFWLDLCLQDYLCLSFSTWNTAPAAPLTQGGEEPGGTGRVGPSCLLPPSPLDGPAPGA